MKITAIKQQVKRPDRYSIFVEGKYSFSLGEGEFAVSGLHSGLEITEAEIEDYKDQSEFGKLFEKTLNLLSFRPRSEWELRDYLKRKKQSPAVIDKILNKLSNSGYVDDKKFAQRWVESRHLLKPTSRRRLTQELRQKRISDAVIEEVLSDDDTDERKVLEKLVERKRARYPDKLKFMQYLARQGYNYDDIKEVLKD